MSVHQYLHASCRSRADSIPSQVRICQRCQITNDANRYLKWHDAKQTLHKSESIWSHDFLLPVYTALMNILHNKTVRQLQQSHVHL